MFDSPQWQYWFPILFLILFPLWWIFIMVVISRWSGWSQLAACYPDMDLFEGMKWRGQSLGMRRGSSYGGCVNFGANETGLRLSLMFLFRPGSSPIVIPWEELTVAELKRSWWYSTVDLRTDQLPDIPLIISLKLIEKIRDAVPESKKVFTDEWFEEEPE